jgi:hypothetical protein
MIVAKKSHHSKITTNQNIEAQIYLSHKIKGVSVVGTFLS